MDSNTGFNIPLNPLAHKSYLTLKKIKDFLPLDAVWKSNLVWGRAVPKYLYSQKKKFLNTNGYYFYTTAYSLLVFSATPSNKEHWVIGQMGKKVWWNIKHTWLVWLIANLIAVSPAVPLYDCSGWINTEKPVLLTNYYSSPTVSLQ